MANRRLPMRTKIKEILRLHFQAPLIRSPDRSKLLGISGYRG